MMIFIIDCYRLFGGWERENCWLWQWQLIQSSYPAGWSGCQGHAGISFIHVHWDLWYVHKILILMICGSKFSTLEFKIILDLGPPKVFGGWFFATIGSFLRDPWQERTRKNTNHHQFFWTFFGSKNFHRSLTDSGQGLLMEPSVIFLCLLYLSKKIFPWWHYAGFTFYLYWPPLSMAVIR